MGNAHWRLEQFDNPNATFESVYYYGGSKSNSWIEAWSEELRVKQSSRNAVQGAQIKDIC